MAGTKKPKTLDLNKARAQLQAHRSKLHVLEQRRHDINSEIRETEGIIADIEKQINDEMAHLMPAPGSSRL